MPFSFIRTHPFLRLVWWLALIKSLKSEIHYLYIPLYCVRIFMCIYIYIYTTSSKMKNLQGLQLISLYVCVIIWYVFLIPNCQMNMYPFYKSYVHSTSVNILHIHKSYMCDTTTHNPRHPLSKGAPPKPQNILGRNLTKISECTCAFCVLYILWYENVWNEDKCGVYLGAYPPPPPPPRSQPPQPLRPLGCRNPHPRPAFWAALVL